MLQRLLHSLLSEDHLTETLTRLPYCTGGGGLEPDLVESNLERAGKIEESAAGQNRPLWPLFAMGFAWRFVPEEVSPEPTHKTGKRGSGRGFWRRRPLQL